MFALALVAPSLGYGADIPGSDVKLSGGWAVYGYTKDSDGSFSHCAGVKRFPGRPFFLVSQTTDGTWRLGLSSPNWKLDSNSNTHVHIKIDNVWETEADGEIVSATIFTITHNNNDFMSAFQLGNNITVTTAGAQWTFPLVGSNQVVQAVQLCTAKYGAPNNPFQSSNSTNPFSSIGNRSATPATATSSPKPDSGSSKNDARAYLIAGFKSNKFPNFRILAKGETLEYFKNSELSWKSESVIGGFFIIGKDVTLDQQQKKIISDDSSACGSGEFASGAKDTEKDNVSIRRIFTSCSGKENVNTSYSLYPLKDGGFYLVTTLGFEYSKVHEADDIFYRYILGNN